MNKMPNRRPWGGTAPRGTFTEHLASIHSSNDFSLALLNAIPKCQGFDGTRQPYPPPPPFMTPARAGMRGKARAREQVTRGGRGSDLAPRGQVT